MALGGCPLKNWTFVQKLVSYCAWQTSNMQSHWLAQKFSSVQFLVWIQSESMWGLDSEIEKYCYGSDLRVASSSIKSNLSKEKTSKFYVNTMLPTQSTSFVESVLLTIYNCTKTWYKHLFFSISYCLLSWKQNDLIGSMKSVLGFLIRVCRYCNTGTVKYQWHKNLGKSSCCNCSRARNNNHATNPPDILAKCQT